MRYERNSEVPALCERIDKRTGQRTVLVPAYPGEEVEHCQRVVRGNIKTLESLGYVVVRVPTRVCELTGGIHCLVNVLQ